MFPFYYIVEDCRIIVNVFCNIFVIKEENNNLFDQSKELLLLKFHVNRL